MTGVFAFAHSHTHSMRTRAGDEVLVVRVRTRAGGVGFGFTFCEDVGAARAMALADASARMDHRSLADWLAGQTGALREDLRRAAPTAPPDHPWVIAWRSALGLPPGGTPTAAPGHGIDWSFEPEFARLQWHDPPQG